MSQTFNQPVNKNLLMPVSFMFGIKRLPNTNFFVQKANIPRRYNKPPEVTNPFKNFPVSGDKIVYEDFMLTFKVDEDLMNYMEIVDWMTGLNFPNNHDQHRILATKPTVTGDSLYSDGTLTILSSSRNPIVEVNYTNMFPVDISSVDFDSTDSQIQFVTCTTRFKYQDMSIKRLTN